jgi:hypothetical protein
MYPAGVGYEATLERFWWRHAQYETPEITLTMRPWVKKTGGDYFTPDGGPRWTAASKTRTANAGEPLPEDPPSNNSGALERIDPHVIGESFAFELFTSDAEQGFTLDYLAFVVAARGMSER